MGDNLTVELEGAIHELPLAQLNAESQKLAQSLAEESSRPGPQAGVGKDEPQEWKDVNGRTIRARFIKLVTETLTIEMNGQPFDLPLASLSPDSQAFARQLASDVKSPPDKTPQEKPVDEQIAKAMGNGPPDQAEITLATEPSRGILKDFGRQGRGRIVLPAHTPAQGHRLLRQESDVPQNRRADSRSRNGQR